MKPVLVLLFLQLVPYFAFAESPRPAEAKLVYLSHLHAVNRLYLDSNRDFLEALRGCLQQKAANQQKADSKSDSSSVQIIQKFISLSGEETKVEEVCDQFVERWLKTLVREHTDLRKSMILREPSAREDNFLLSHTIDAEPQYKVNLRPRHKQVIAMSGYLTFAEAQDATSTEIQKYSADLDRHTSAKCDEFSKARRLNSRFQNIDVCDYLTFRNWSNKPELGYEDESDLRILQKNFLIWLFYERESYRRDRQSDYEEAGTLNPILLYLGSARPSWQELIAAVESTLRNHDGFVARTGIESVSNNRLAFSFAEAKKQDVSEIQKNVRHLENILRDQRFDKNLSAYLRNVEPSYDFEPLVTETQAAWESRRSRGEMALAAIAIGANVGCFLPKGKLIKIALRTGCLVAVGFGFNTFFVLKTRAELESELERLLMSTTSRYNRAQLGKAEEKRIAFLAAALLWPVGLWP